MLTVVVTLSGAIQCSHSVWSKFAVTHCPFPESALFHFFKNLLFLLKQDTLSLWFGDKSVETLVAGTGPCLKAALSKVHQWWLSWLLCGCHGYSLCFLSCFLLRPVWQSTFYARVELAASPVTLCLCVLVDCQTWQGNLAAWIWLETVIPSYLWLDLAAYHDHSWKDLHRSDIYLKVYLKVKSLLWQQKTDF